MFLPEKFKKLSLIEKDCLLTLSILGDYTTQTDIVRRMKAVGLRNSKGNQYTGAECKVQLEKLQKAGFVIKQPNGWCLPHQFDSLAIGYAYLDENYVDRLSMILQSDLPISNPNRAFRSFGFRDLYNEARAAYYLGDDDTLMKTVFPQYDFIDSDPVSLDFTILPFNPELLATKPEQFQNLVLKTVLDDLLDSTVNPDRFLEYLSKSAQADYPIHLIRGDLAVVTGDPDRVKVEAAPFNKHVAKKSADEGLRIQAVAAGLGWQASLEFMRGNEAQAIDLFEQCIKTLRAKTRKVKLAPWGISCFFYQLALIKRGGPGDYEKAIQLYSWADEVAPTSRSPLLKFAADMAECYLGQGKQFVPRVIDANDSFLAHPSDNIYLFAYVLMARLTGVDHTIFKPWISRFKQLSETASAEKYYWLAREAKAMEMVLKEKSTSADQKAMVKLEKAIPLDQLGEPLAEIFSPPETWEADLSAIEAIARKYGRSAKAKKKKSKKKAATRKEVIWLIEFDLDDDYDYLEIQPMLRSITAKGKASKGRNIALKTIKQSPSSIEGMTEQDFKVVETIKKTSKWGYEDYAFQGTKSLQALAGHPLVFCVDDIYNSGERTPVKIKKGRFQIDASESKSGKVNVTLKPRLIPSDRWGMIVQDNPAEITIYEITPEVRGLQEAIGNQNKLTLPEKAKTRFFNAVTDLAETVDIAADGNLASTSEADLESGDSKLTDVESDARPRLRLFPDGEGIMVQLVVQPLMKCEHRFAPGEGRESIFGIVDNQRIRGQRDLATESKHANWLIDNTPSLATRRGELADLWTWQFPEPIDCLQLLKELYDLPEDCEQHPYIVEWPEEQPFKLQGVVSATSFNGSLGSANEWLTISGDVQINNDLVLSMRELIDAASNSSKQGFLELSKGEFIALTESFSRQLDDIRSLAQPGKSDKIKLPPLAALALEDFVEESATSKPGKAWKEWITRIREAQQHHPDTPGNLQAELRPYQLDGYRWLSRLAKGGAGACLADDMGLGKTIQTLCLLLERAEQGPALVIAPTSVAANWLDETLKFAPTLNCVVFGQGDRQKQLGSLKPYDLVICTYGLLQREADALGEIEFSTVVLDEAQAIKNSATKRSKAARDLQADFRIVTTGTPVENRLSELHTLFQFIIPGYLGSWDKFRKTFADPIEKDQDAAARDRLRRLIKPFMLRRLKSGVLKDLPARTEVNMHVELEVEEAAFYEALRQEAVEAIEEGSDEGKPGQKAFQILAQLTKLRRACCHPVLVDKKNGAKLGSSKLAAFSETVSDILSGNHKVLIFSQFVDHLKLIRDELDQKGITYQYLDGSTSKPKRKAAVDAFQRGQSDAFLISLKAGGFGLNLTAADYVIHMDPWWNPAAEDQASDRAHRIGQTRPVTIYRFITKGTIEEKIVALHHKKRELAESLLSGTDVADSKLSPEELMKLLKETN